MRTVQFETHDRSLCLPWQRAVDIHCQAQHQGRQLAALAGWPPMTCRDDGLYGCGGLSVRANRSRPTTVVLESPLADLVRWRLDTAVAPVRLPHGFRQRPASLDDVAAFAELGNTFSEAARGDRPFSQTRSMADWQSPGITPESNVRVVQDADGKLVGAVELMDDGEPPVRNWVFGFVHPKYAGRGIGTSLLSWAECRAREAIPRCPADSRVVLQPRIFSGHAPSERLVRDHGFELQRHVWQMELPFDGPPKAGVFPEGIELRPYRHDADLLAVVRADREAFRDHWGYVEQPLEHELAEWRHWIATSEEFDPRLWLVAYDGGVIAGLCISVNKTPLEPNFGYVNTLAVRRPWRRRGLATALLRQAFAELAARGRSGAILHVDAANVTGATRLYERAGMRQTHQIDWYQKELRPGRDLIVTG